MHANDAWNCVHLQITFLLKKIEIICALTLRTEGCTLLQNLIVTINSKIKIFHFTAIFLELRIRIN